DNDLLICWGAIHRNVEKGRTIFYEGDDAHFYYQIISGKIRMSNCKEDGREFVQGLYGAGESFGELPLFDEETYIATAIAVEESILLRLPKERFLQLLKDNVDIHFAFTRLLAQRVRFKSMFSKEIGCSAPEKVIGMLIRKFAADGKDSPNGVIKVELTRQQIADMTGLRVETVIRTIRDMYRKGEILLERGKVYIMDVKGCLS
ncbi:MAG: Crp/Fnr family transcriptional regulator, partial [Chitinophaga rupis]